jgi:flagellar biosynthesis/type III secretory pathway chaperone
MEQLLDDEQEAINLSAKDRFDRLQQEKEALVTNLQTLEDKRKRLVDRLNAGRSTGNRPHTVSQLAKTAQAPYNRQLLACTKRLRPLIEAVQKKNTRNQKLINQSLDLINSALRLLSDLIDGSPVYQKPGLHQPTLGFRPGGGRFVRGSV